MNAKAVLSTRRSAQHGADDAPTFDGLVGAALALSAAALMLAALAYTTELTLDTKTRAIAITVAIVLGAVAGRVGHRLRHHRVPADRLRPRSAR